METRPRTYCRRNHSHQPHPRPIVQKKLALHLSHQIPSPRFCRNRPQKLQTTSPFHIRLLQVRTEPDLRADHIADTGRSGEEELPEGQWALGMELAFFIRGNPRKCQR